MGFEKHHTGENCYSYYQKESNNFRAKFLLFGYFKTLDM